MQQGARSQTCQRRKRRACTSLCWSLYQLCWSLYQIMMEAVPSAIVSSPTSARIVEQVTDADKSLQHTRTHVKRNQKKGDSVPTFARHVTKASRNHAILEHTKTDLGVEQKNRSSCHQLVNIKTFSMVLFYMIVKRRFLLRDTFAGKNLTEIRSQENISEKLSKFYRQKCRAT